MTFYKKIFKRKVRKDFSQRTQSIKNIIFIILLLIVHCTLKIEDCMCQSGWNQLFPYPCRFINTVQFVNLNTGWFVGDGIVKTTDGGLTFVKQSDSSYFIGCFFIDGNTGWVLTSYNYLYSTINGGNNWSVTVIIDSEYYKSVYFLNSNTGWLSGYKIGSNGYVSSGLVRKTTNNGINWISLPGFTNFRHKLNSMFFNDVNSGYIGSDDFDSSIIKTTNGGINWSFTNMGTQISYIRFQNSNTGFAIGYDNGKLYKTTNAGANWSIISIGGNYVNSFCFKDANTGWATGGYTGGIYYYGLISNTTNGGLSWNQQTYNFDFSSINFPDYNNGLVAGSNGEILKTTNSGINWNFKNSSLSMDCQSVFFNDNNTGWVVGYYNNDPVDKGKIYKTINGGLNWIRIAGDTLEPFYSVTFVNSNIGWVLGEKNLYKTTNSGISWNSQINSDTDLFLCDFFINSNTGWVKGFNSFYKTTNGGINWVNLNNVFCYNLFFVNENTGWGGSSKGCFYKTTDGGYNWTQYSCNPWQDTPVGPFYFINSNMGWFVIGNLIFKTNKGGNNWSYFNCTSYEAFSSIYFVNQLTGFAVGEYIWKSTSGGNNWYKYTDKYYGYFNSVFFKDANTGWIVGNNSVILKTTDGGNIFVSKNSSVVPTNFYLSQNYPNPFNPTTKIKFDIPAGPVGQTFLSVTLKIYDILGREIQTLVNEKLQPGSYEVTFDGSNLSSGIYFYQLKAGEYIENKKMVLIK